MTKSDLLNDYAFSLFEPRERQSVTEWAEANAYLSERTTEMAGQYRTDSYPYVREVLNCFADPLVRRVALCWGSQTGKTTTLLCGLGWAVDQSPAPILWVWSNEKQARNFAQDRLLPFCEDSETLAEHLPKTSDGLIDRDRASALHVQFDTCTLNMVGGQSQRNVRNFPVSYLLMDEIDVIPESIRREALERIKGRRNYKVVQSSTPLEENTGIWSEFLMGDQRKWFMPCPHCGKWISFALRQGKDKYNLKYDPKAKTKDGKYDFYRIKETAYYQCHRCRGKINDDLKLKMMAKGEWRPTSKTGEPNCRSYHLNSLYSPTIPLYEMLFRWLQANSSVDGLRQYITGWLAEPWHDEVMNVSEEATKLLAGTNERGELVGDYRLLGIDVQRSHFYWICRGFNMDGSSSLIDHGICASWADLDTFFRTYECSAAIIDTGYGERTQECYEQIFKRRNQFWGCKGWKKLASGPYTVKSFDPFSGKQSKKGKHRIRLLHIDTEVWGGELLKRRNRKVKGFSLYRDPDPEYIKQLNAKYLIEKTDRKGLVQVEWRTKGHGQDHYWDCELYTLCLSKVLGLGNIARAQNKERAKTENENSTQKQNRTRGGKATESFW